MRKTASMLAIAFALSAAAPAFAQDGTAALQDAGANLEAAQAEAQAAAIHPGDEALTCEQIQAEMGASMNTPEMLAQRGEMQASVERQQAMQEEARQRAAGMMTTSIVTGIVGSFIPGVGYAQAAAMQAQAAQQQAAANESQTEMAGMIGNMSEMMPTMMRGQRLYELAQARECEFLEQMQPQN
jgi:hypothetical protein